MSGWEAPSAMDHGTLYWDWMEHMLTLPWFSTEDDTVPLEPDMVDLWTPDNLRTTLTGHWITEDAWVAPCPLCGIRGALAARNVEDDGVAMVVLDCTNGCAMADVVQTIEDRTDSWLDVVDPDPGVDVLDALRSEVSDLRSEIADLLGDEDDDYLPDPEPDPDPTPDPEPAGLLPVFDLDTLLTRPDPVWAVEDLFMADTVAIVGGESGAGKSFLMLDIAAHVASGMHWHGKAVRQGKVLYVAAEGEGGLAKRIRAWEYDKGVHIPRDRFQIATAPVNLSMPDALKPLGKRVAYSQPSLIVLDTFAQVSGVESENDSAQVGKALNSARDLRRAAPGATVVIVHHVTKADNRGLRGSSALKANVDTVAIMYRDGSSAVLSTEATKGGKQKDGEPLHLSGITLRDVKVPHHASSAVVDIAGGSGRHGAVSDEDMVLAMLMSGPKSLHELSGDENATRQRLKRLLPSMIEDGSVAKEGSGPATRYRLTD